MMMTAVTTEWLWISYNSNTRFFTEVQLNISNCLLDIHYGTIQCYINALFPNELSHPILYNSSQPWFLHLGILIFNLIKQTNLENLSLPYLLYPSGFQISSVFLINMSQLLSLHSFLSCLGQNSPSLFLELLSYNKITFKKSRYNVVISLTERL